MSEVDIILPVYNARATIDAAVGSILNQTVRAIRLIMVDDGSDDGTAQRLDTLARADSRIVLVRTENRGIVDSLNLALGLCEAPYIARHDADDIAFPERLAVQLSHMRAYPDCIALGCNAYHIDAEGRRTGTRTAFLGDVTPNARTAPSHEPYLLHPFLMVRSETIKAIGGYRHVVHAEDTDLYWRLLGHGRLQSLDAILGEYRIHAGSVTSRSVLNGRVSAIHSQRAAISYRRRLASRPDIAFPRDAQARYEAAGSLAAMIGLACEDLDSEEAAWIEIAVAAKLLNLSAYRPFRLEVADLAYMKDVFGRRMAMLAPANRHALRRSWLAALVRLGRAGNRADVDALAPGMGGTLLMAAKWSGGAIRRKLLRGGGSHD